MTSNAVPPSVTPPSTYEWPQDLVKTITGITRDSVARVTIVGHGFTSLDINLTFGCFKQVKGMIQMNGIEAVIVDVLNVDNFFVNVNTTNFYQYVSDGVFIVDTGQPPIERQGFQYFNTPFQNIA